MHAPHEEQVTVEAGETADVQVRMRPGCTLTGVVRHADGAPATGARVLVGRYGDFASHYTVQRLAGFAVAADLLLSGRMLLGRELAELGLASRALPAERVLPEALAYARDFVHTAPVSVAITKRMLWRSTDLALSELQARESALFAWVGDQADAREGIESFLEKRAPSWKMSAASDLPDIL